uniref:Uncharacterized protein n=1 Tax=Marseillevirus LCMAC101 TaxID=2506602 RepID=A0A481YSG9_9VIRU|nr:MAG: hypothetical protein LCMAC101_05020 [Marseillevirus LCMAC101]
MNGQVNLYIYDPEKMNCHVGGVAQQLCKKINYPLHVRKIFDVEKSEAWKDFMAYMSLLKIPAADEEGDNKKSPVFSVILVSYRSLCTSYTPEANWYQWLNLEEEPHELHKPDGELIRKMVKVCEMIMKKSLRFPPLIISGFVGTAEEVRELDRDLRSWGIPDHGAIYLDEKDKNESIEGLEFNINYFIQTFWQANYGRM